MFRSGKFNVAMFIIPLYLLLLFFLLDFDKSEQSELEMRSLHEKPTFTWGNLWSGQYFRDFENYFSDHFVFRENFIQASQVIQELRSGFSSHDLKIVVNPTQSLSHMAQSNESDIQSLDSQMFENYLVVGNQAMFLYYYREYASDIFAETLNQIQQSLTWNPDIYSMIVPTVITFVDHPEVKEIAPSQQIAIEKTYSKYKDGIEGVDVYAKLDQHKNEYIYYRTDHHWTSLGAYYAYVAYMEHIGEEPVPLDQYESWAIAQFLGTAYNATLQQSLADSPDYITVYEPIVDYTYERSYRGKMSGGKLVDSAYAKAYGGYAVFLGGDSPWAKINTEVKNGKSIIVVKDSYANPMIPFLLPHYEHIYLADLRYYEGDFLQFINEIKPDEVLFLNNSSVTAHPGYTRNLIEKFGLDIET